VRAYKRSHFLIRWGAYPAYPNLVYAVARPSGMADTRENGTPVRVIIFINTKFRRSKSNHMGVGKELPEIWGLWGPARWDGAWLTPCRHAPTPLVLSYQIWLY